MSNRTTQGVDIYLDTLSADVNLGRVAPSVVIFTSTKAADRIVFTDYEDNPLFELRTAADNGTAFIYFPKGRMYSKLRAKLASPLTGTGYVYIIQQ